VEIGFPEAVLTIGLLLFVAASLSGVMHGTVLSISVLSVAAGIGLAEADVVTVDPHDASVIALIELALVLTLFSDGMLVDRELLRLHWSAPVRAIAVAMPITLVLLAGAALVLFPDLGWEEAFLLAAVLTPTDPVVTSSVVSARGVPAVVRHTLNLESGLNDGLALPFVLFFLVLAERTGGAGSEAATLLAEAGVGAAIGAGLGYLGGITHRRVPGGGITHRYEGIWAIGLGLSAFGLAEVTFGNGLIAAFVAGVALGISRHEAPQGFMDLSESASAVFQVLTFFVFGALIVATGYHGSVWALVAFVPFVLLVARPAALLLSFTRTGLPRAQKLFMAWFGPKGVASMLFALFVLKSQAEGGSAVFDVAAFVILASIAAHGLTDTVGARWIERRMRE
jgi:NhaP-type Na+/H+ or K+/H+ antiporter